MSVAVFQAVCSVCGDRFSSQPGDCCGRCQRIVCPACSARRGRTHESVLCVECRGVTRPSGFRGTPLYRSWVRLRLGSSL